MGACRRLLGVIMTDHNGTWPDSEWNRPRADDEDEHGGIRSIA